MIDEIEEIKTKIFTKRNLRKAFTERELKEMLENDNFYKPETLWFTKEMIEADIPRIVKLIKNQTRQTNRPFQKDRGDVLAKSLKRSGRLNKAKTAETFHNKGCTNWKNKQRLRLLKGSDNQNYTNPVTDDEPGNIKRTNSK